MGQSGRKELDMRRGLIVGASVGLLVVGFAAGVGVVSTVPSVYAAGPMAILGTDKIRGEIRHLADPDTKGGMAFRVQLGGPNTDGEMTVFATEKGGRVMPTRITLGGTLAGVRLPKRLFIETSRLRNRSQKLQ